MNDNPGIRIADMPDLGGVTDATSFVGELAGSGRFSAPNLRAYMAETFGNIDPVNGAAGDGATNDTTIIQAAITAHAGGTLAITRPGTYMVTGLTIAAAMTLALGTGVTLKLSAGANAKLINITASNVRIVGPGTLDANGETGTGASPEPIAAATVNGITIDGLTILNSAGYGIHMVDCSQVTIRNCTITRCALYSIGLYTSAVATADYTITGNRIDRTDTAYDPNGAGHCIAILNINGAGLQTNRGIISGNLCLGKNNPVSQGVGITLFASTPTLQPFFDWTVADNSVSLGYFGLTIGQGVGLSVTGNSIYNHKDYGIELVSAQDCAVSGNAVFGGANSTHGIVVDSVDVAAPSNSLAIVGNTVRGCSAMGIYTFQHCNRIAIVGNSIEQATGSGIVDNSGGDITVCGNSISGLSSSGGVAIDLTGNTRAVLSGNNIDLWLTPNPYGSLGSGAKVADFITVSEAWTPGLIAAGASARHNVGALGVLPGDLAVASFSPTLVAGLFMSATCNTDVIAIDIGNVSAGGITIGAGTVKVNAWKS